MGFSRIECSVNREKHRTRRPVLTAHRSVLQPTSTSKIIAGYRVTVLVMSFNANKKRGDGQPVVLPAPEIRKKLGKGFFHLKWQRSIKEVFQDGMQCNPYEVILPMHVENIKHLPSTGTR